MFYYELVNMNNLRLEERTVVENIYLILNQEWNYEEVEETKKMMEMFEDSEKILSRFMAIKELDVKNRKITALLNLSDEEKRLAMIEEPEKWIAELEEKGEEVPADPMDGLKFDEAETEKIKALGVFVLKIAVYRFCTVHLPKITGSVDQKTGIDPMKAGMLENELEEWEKKIWMDESPLVGDMPNIFMKRKLLISCYSGRLWGYDSKHVWTCIKKAYKDDETFASVKALRLAYGSKKGGRNEKGKKLQK